MLVAFWGPVHGQVRTTSNMIAISTMLALDYQMRILITHTHAERSTLEMAYSKLRQVDIYREVAAGMDGIEHLAQCGMLTPESIKDNAESIVHDRLDLIPGLTNLDVKSFKRTLPFIIESARRFYNLTFIDVSSGTKNEISQYVMEQADLVVVNLNQNSSVLDTFFSRQDWPSILDQKPVIYCLGSYERNSKMTTQRIASRYSVSRKKIGAIPHNYRYMDAHNEQHIIDFLLRARSREKKFLQHDEEVYFTESVRNVGKQILHGLGLVPLQGDDDD
ncbi:hypothetical protein [Paenibacillus guangzhouensis]|uniref:hypothetical protein n=1 Tax=Paenibacillus guangzhouensis TaxID=1473112 RepID=UPI001266E1FA|nr:hypothetical protein [Paenibacillus guangzhouensis]